MKNASKSLNDIERQINTEGNAYMIYQVKELYFKLNQKDFVDELIFNNFEKSSLIFNKGPLNYLFSKKIYDNLLDLLSKKNAKDLLNDDDLISNSVKKNKSMKKKSQLNQKCDNKTKEIRSIDNDKSKIESLKNHDLFVSLNTNDSKKGDLFEGLTVMNKNQLENKNNSKTTENKSNNENLHITEIKISHNNIKTLRENLDYQVKSIVPYVKLNDNCSELNDTDSQYTSTHFSDNRSVIFNFNKYITKKSPSFDRILQKDNSKIKERKSVPPLYRNEEEVKKEEPSEKKEEEKMKINLEEIMESNINCIESDDNEKSNQENTKKNKKKRQQKFKKQKQTNQVCELKKSAPSKKTDLKNNKNSETNNDKIDKRNSINLDTKDEVEKNELIKLDKKENLTNVTNVKSEEIKNTKLIEIENNDVNYKAISFRNNNNNYNQFRVYNDNPVNYKNNTKNYNKFNKTNNGFYQPHPVKQTNSRLNHNFLNKNHTIITHNPSFIPQDNYFNNQFYYNFLIANNQVYFKDNLNTIQSKLNEETKIYSNGVSTFNSYISEFKNYSIYYLQQMLSKSLSNFNFLSRH